ncbi:hypothetical protein FBZ89_102487 [Nitrospirillum amazonense]|uniref:Uncharacterized protein n=1 Tax=Nitrospirillum amazonense TaxID=28077 RepID=A0A560FQC6_9PROT|nr:hypothetical protein [Nitrospirillum amazonense]TWB23730.1 hypothetical protein FBZ89_102487 [Nitrospirillum amazonense]
MRVTHGLSGLRKALGDDGQVQDAATLLSYPAAALFFERACHTLAGAYADSLAAAFARRVGSDGGPPPQTGVGG